MEYETCSNIALRVLAPPEHSPGEKLNTLGVPEVDNLSAQELEDSQRAGATANSG